MMPQEGKVENGNKLQMDSVPESSSGHRRGRPGDGRRGGVDVSSGRRRSGGSGATGAMGKY